MIMRTKYWLSIFLERDIKVEAEGGQEEWKMEVLLLKNIYSLLEEKQSVFFLKLVNNLM